MKFRSFGTAALIDPSIRWLMLIALACLVLVLGLKVFFDGLQDELRERSANEQARLFVGEEIVRSIHGIEKDLYLLAASNNPTAARRVGQSIERQLTKLRHDLRVLKEGGTVRREVLLNIEGRDEMVREASYRPNSNDSTYVMELIEIEPLLDQIGQKSGELASLLARGWDFQEDGDHRAFFDLRGEVDVFLKHIPPYFARLDENANRLFFDSSDHLRQIEEKLAHRRAQLKQLEMGFIALAMILAGLVGTLFLRRINIANQELEAALDEMRRAKEEAERASRAKSQFVSRMSHELRTPLNAILGFADLLSAEPLPASQKGYVELINSSGKHLMELINAVLDHAKIEAGGMTLESIDYDLRATLESVHNIVLERAGAKGLRLTADIAAELPRHVVGDPVRVRQVLINLLMNAVKFTEHGAVELRAAVDGQQLVFEIRDTGIGMDEAGLGRLFKPFSQADETITRKYGGTGLGLLISKELVEAMGGRIAVESTPGVGTCFTIRLPLHLADRRGADTTAALAPPHHASLPELLGGRVLLVDDNRVNQQLGAAMLKRLKLDFDVADNGVQALLRIAAAEYALVLMDMEMPEMDGLAATREIRRREAELGVGRHLPIIAMTANALAEDRQRCFAAGMDGYISKPVGMASLEAEIGRLFAERNVIGQPPGNAPQAAPVFDRDGVIEMLGDEELFRELAVLFVADAPRHLDTLDTSLAGGDWEALTRCAHTLKGLFATFVAAPAEADARRLEQAASQGDEAGCRELVPAVRADTEALAAALAQPAQAPEAA